MAYGKLYVSPTTQHAVTGKANQDETFGADGYKHKPNREPKVSRKPELREHERGIGPTLKPLPKRMPMQAAPDHGDHYE